MCILKNDTKRTAQVGFLYLIYIYSIISYLTILDIIKSVDIDSIITDFSILYIVETVYKVSYCSLSCTCSTYKSNFLTRGCI